VSVIHLQAWCVLAYLFYVYAIPVVSAAQPTHGKAGYTMLFN